MVTAVAGVEEVAARYPFFACEHYVHRQSLDCDTVVLIIVEDH